MMENENGQVTDCKKQQSRKKTQRVKKNTYVYREHDVFEVPETTTTAYLPGFSGSYLPNTCCIITTNTSPIINSTGLKRASSVSDNTITTSVHSTVCSNVSLPNHISSNHGNECACDKNLTFSESVCNIQLRSPSETECNVKSLQNVQMTSITNDSVNFEQDSCVTSYLEVPCSSKPETVLGGRGIQNIKSPNAAQICGTANSMAVRSQSVYTATPTIVSSKSQSTSTVESVVPFGWKRLLESGSIVYYSPTNQRLYSYEQVRVYLSSSTTCKCGLECPIHIHKIFNFEPSVQSCQWTPQIPNHLTNLCHHRKKAIAMANMATMAALANNTSLQLADLNHTLIGPGPVQSMYKETKTKRTRKPKKVSPYDGVLVSQLLAQRDKINQLAAFSSPTGPNPLQGDGQMNVSMEVLTKQASDLKAQEEIVNQQIAAIKQKLAETESLRKNEEPPKKTKRRKKSSQDSGFSSSPVRSPLKSATSPTGPLSSNNVMSPKLPVMSPTNMMMPSVNTMMSPTNPLTQANVAQSKKSGTLPKSPMVLSPGKLVASDVRHQVPVPYQASVAGPSRGMHRFMFGQLPMMSAVPPNQMAPAMAMVPGMMNTTGMPRFNVQGMNFPANFNPGVNHPQNGPVIQNGLSGMPPNVQMFPRNQFPGMRPGAFPMMSAPAGNMMLQRPPMPMFHMGCQTFPGNMPTNGPMGAQPFPSWPEMQPIKKTRPKRKKKSSSDTQSPIASPPSAGEIHPENSGMESGSVPMSPTSHRSGSSRSNMTSPLTKSPFASPSVHSFTGIESPSVLNSSNFPASSLLSAAAKAQQNQIESEGEVIASLTLPLNVGSAVVLPSSEKNFVETSPVVSLSSSSQDISPIQRVQDMLSSLGQGQGHQLQSSDVVQNQISPRGRRASSTSSTSSWSSRSPGSAKIDTSTSHNNTALNAVTTNCATFPVGSTECDSNDLSSSIISTIVSASQQVHNVMYESAKGISLPEVAKLLSPNKATVLSDGSKSPKVKRKCRKSSTPTIASILEARAKNHYHLPMINGPGTHTGTDTPSGGPHSHLLHNNIQSHLIMKDTWDRLPITKTLSSTEDGGSLPVVFLPINRDTADMVVSSSKGLVNIGQPLGILTGATVLPTQGDSLETNMRDREALSSGNKGKSLKTAPGEITENSVSVANT